MIAPTRWMAARKLRASLSYRVAMARQMLHRIEEPLDEVAPAIEREVALARCDAIGFGRGDGGDSSPRQGPNQGVGVIGLVVQQGLRTDFSEQRLGFAKVGRLSGREREGEWIAQSIDDRVDLGREPAP